MSALALLFLALLFALAGLFITLAFSRACFYASLLDELDGSTPMSPSRRARARAGRTSIAHGRATLEPHAQPVAGHPVLRHKPC